MNRTFASVFVQPLILLAACATPEPQVKPDQVAALGLPSYSAPLPGIVTAGQISEPQLRDLAKLGPIRIINLRAAGEPGTDWEPGLAKELGMTYVHLPIRGAEDLTEANARKLAEVLAGRPGETLDLVHCASSNRVGALLALKAYYIDGEDAEEAFALGKSAGMTRLEPDIRQKLGL